MDDAKRGWCRRCNRQVRVTVIGLTGVHGPRTDRCPGSGEEPSTEPPTGRRQPRWVETLQLASQGLDSAEIGDRMWVTEDTVKTQLRRAYATLGARNRAQAVHIACHQGLLDCQRVLADG